MTNSEKKASKGEEVCLQVGELEDFPEDSAVSQAEEERPLHSLQVAQEEASEVSTRPTLKNYLSKY